jgi:hypothetical protein
VTRRPGRLRPWRLLVAALALTAVLAPSARATTPRLPLARVHMINYYPAGRPWSAMWVRWDAAGIDADLAKVASLGANAVRLIVPPAAFGYPTPSATMQAHLHDAVAMAAAHGLAVQLTLFDWFGGYTDVRGSKAWATAIAHPFANDPRVSSIELRNELDLADPTAVAWARALLPHLQRQVGDVPTTISVNGPATSVGLLRGLLAPVTPTFWSYHYYDGTSGDRARAAFAVARAGAGRQPLYLGETGADSWARRGESAATAEARQAAFLAAVFAAAAAEGLPAPAPWTYSDFADGTLPAGSQPRQAAFGLVRLDGSEKPAAAVVRAAFTGG